MAYAKWTITKPARIHIIREITFLIYKDFSVNCRDHTRSYILISIKIKMY